LGLPDQYLSSGPADLRDPQIGRAAFSDASTCVTAARSIPVAWGL
jgi:hypothetical protein